MLGNIFIKMANFFFLPVYRHIYSFINKYYVFAQIDTSFFFLSIIFKNLKQNSTEHKAVLPPPTLFFFFLNERSYLCWDVVYLASFAAPQISGWNGRADTDTLQPKRQWEPFALEEIIIFGSLD